MDRERHYWNRCCFASSKVSPHCLGICGNRVENTELLMCIQKDFVAGKELSVAARILSYLKIKFDLWLIQCIRSISRLETYDYHQHVLIHMMDSMRSIDHNRSTLGSNKSILQLQGGSYHSIRIPSVDYCLCYWSLSLPPQETGGYILSDDIVAIPRRSAPNSPTHHSLTSFY